MENNEKIPPRWLKTKIIATIGPASFSKEVMQELIKEGVSCARLNGAFVVRDTKKHKEIIALLREVNPSLPIMIDVPGPKIRLATTKPVPLNIGDEVIFSETDVPVTSYESFSLLSKGEVIYADDATFKFEVISVESTKLVCKALNEGLLLPSKGINLPFTSLKGAFISDRDREILKFARDNEVDFVSASFVRNKDDIAKIRKEIKDAALISKVENIDALKNLDEIVFASDGIMIDRGDLGAESGVETLPVTVKNIIKKANMAGKPIILATQLLNTMIEKPHPTRAEISDIANAIIDGASALMLSGETAIGKYPVDAIKVCASICKSTESLLDYTKNNSNENEKLGAIGTVAKNISNMALDLNLRDIIYIGEQLNSPVLISSFRPRSKILCITSSKKIERQLNLIWGCKGIYKSDTKDVQGVLDYLKTKGEFSESEGHIIVQDKAGKQTTSIVINNKVN